MADNVVGIKIKDLPEAAQSNLTDSSDLIVEDITPITRKTKISTFIAYIKAKLSVGTASDLNTNKKEIVGAINEINNKNGLCL